MEGGLTVKTSKMKITTTLKLTKTSHYPRGGGGGERRAPLVFLSLNLRYSDETFTVPKDICCCLIS